MKSRAITFALGALGLVLGVPLVVLLLNRSPTVERSSIDTATFAEAARVGVRVEDLFARSRRVLRFWLGRADARTGLMPDFLPEYALGTPKGPNRDGPHYSPADAGADHLAFQVIAAHLTDPELDTTRMPRLLEAERRWAQLPDGTLPEWVNLTTGALGPSSLFAGAEYVKDGLLSVTGLLGPTSPWSARMVELVDATMRHASTPSRFGPLPGDGAELHGDMLLALVPLAWMTGDARYSDFAGRIARAYMEEVLPGNHDLPSLAWDFAEHRGEAVTQLRDHGNEIIAGLTLYCAWLHHHDEARAASECLPTVRRMIDRVLASANPDGLLYNRIASDTLLPVQGSGYTANLSDNWGYVYGAVYNLHLLTGEARYREATLKVMRSLPKYLAHDWTTHPGHDDTADTIESAIYLLAHEDVPEARAWVDLMIDKLVAFQQPSGVVGASYLDGNWMRTALLYALMQTRGATVAPWRPGLRLGAVERDGALYVSIRTDGEPWQGELRLDVPRHRRFFRMPARYVRLNEWPEWFTIDDEAAAYELRLDDGTTRRVSGAELVAGLPVTAPFELRIRRLER